MPLEKGQLEKVSALGKQRFPKLSHGKRVWATLSFKAAFKSSFKAASSASFLWLSLPLQSFSLERNNFRHLVAAQINKEQLKLTLSGAPEAVAEAHSPM